MVFAADLSDTLASIWDADLSVDMRDQYGLSERIMDGIRFDLSHEVINGRPRRRILVTNPHTKKSLPFPAPVKARCEWTRRMREREEAMELVQREGADTCERDFDKTLEKLIARDAQLLRTNFSAARPFTPVLSFDGADNFTHVTLRLCDYKEGVAEESELKVMQLAVAMGDDHYMYPRLEKVVAPSIGPAFSKLKSVTIAGEQVPAEPTMCLDLSAARSAYGRRAGKSSHCKCTDVYTTPKLPAEITAKGAFAIVDKFCKWLEVDELRADAHICTTFPFKCRRKECSIKVIKDAAHRDALVAELAALKANKTVAGKAEYAKAIALHADAHGQQMPYQDPVTSLPLQNLILDLLHGLDLNLPKVAMKYSILDPRLLALDMRAQIADFLHDIGCPLDVREKANRETAKKWFHGSVWHYDFVKGANKKSYGLHVNIFQLCLIVYGVESPAAAGAATPAAAATKKGKAPAPSALVDDFSDDEEEMEEEAADLDSDVIDAELRALFGANAGKVKTVLELWNAYSDIYNAYCDEWVEDTDEYREQRAFKALKAGIAFQDKLNDVSTRRSGVWYCVLLCVSQAVGALDISLAVMVGHFRARKK